MLAEPGRFKELVTPPDAMILIAGSYGLNPSIARTKGVMGLKPGASFISPVVLSLGKELSKWWECMSTRPGVTNFPCRSNTSTLSFFDKEAIKLDTPLGESERINPSSNTMSIASGMIESPSKRVAF